MRGHLRKRGDAWELRAYAGRDPVSNRELYRTRTFRGGKREAERALGKFVQEVADRGPEARDATVGVLVSRWFDLAKADLSPSTVRGYERTIRRYIEPDLGDVSLDRLEVAQLDELYARLRARGGEEGGPLATATIRQVHAVLRRALQQGVKWGWIDSNPAALAALLGCGTDQSWPPSQPSSPALSKRRVTTTRTSARSSRSPPRPGHDEARYALSTGTTWTLSEGL
jgi:integrase